MRHFAFVCGALVLLFAKSTAADEKARVFITDSVSWKVSGGSGGGRPQTAEIIKTFGERCPQVTVTMKQDQADYVVVLEHEGGKGVARKRNKAAVFNKGGDAIYSGSTRSLGNAVKDACAAILRRTKETTKR